MICSPAGFQHVGVESAHGPHVTLVAGVEMAGRHWSTTSASAAKVRMVRGRPHASVLRSEGNGDWMLLSGRATVLDVRRPWDAVADPTAATFAGLALGRIGLANLPQLAGYLDDLSEIPRLWGPASRVLLVVRGDHRLTFSGGVVAETTGAFATIDAVRPASNRQRRRPLDSRLTAELTPSQHAVLATRGRCAVGLSSPIGTVVVPGTWDPDAGTATLDRNVLARLGAVLPGPCSVTLDSSGDAHPTAKVGVMLRGTATAVQPTRVGRAADDGSSASLALRIGSITAWDGFGVATTRAA